MVVVPLRRGIWIDLGGTMSELRVWERITTKMMSPIAIRTVMAMVAVLLLFDVEDFCSVRTSF